MKALSLTQPWASLVAIGEKRIETRSWATRYRGPVAIHAAKSFPGAAQHWCFAEPFRSALLRHPDDLPHYGAHPYTMRVTGLALGAVLAVAELTAVHRIPVNPQWFARFDATPSASAQSHYLASYPVMLPPLRDRVERAFGDYTPGRFAWVLTDVHLLKQPIPCKGALGLWELPADVADAVVTSQREEGTHEFTERRRADERRA